MLASATAHYHDLLTASPGLAAESYGSLCDLQKRNHLTFRNKVLCHSLRPQFIVQRDFEAIFAHTRLLAGAFYKVWADAMRGGPVLEALCPSNEERELLRIDPGYTEALPNTRLDSFFSDDGWYFVEYNTEIPTGIGYEDRLSLIFYDLPVMQAFRKHYHVRMLLCQQAMVEMMRKVYLEYVHNASPEQRPEAGQQIHIAIVDWADVPTATEFEIWREYFEAQGMPAVIAPPAALEYDKGLLRYGNFRIDIVYRRVIANELLARPAEAAALLAAYRDGAVCMVNSFRAKILHKKMSLGVLSDPAYSHLFSEAELQAIRAHIPWTRLVRPGYCDYQGQQVDLLPFLQEHKDDFVIKPNDEYGGKGVVIGADYTQHEWEDALQAALEEPYVVQQRVPIPHNDYPVYDMGDVAGLSFVQLAADLDPFLFGPEPLGLLTRLSSSSLLNVSAGAGSIVPTFVIEKR